MKKETRIIYERRGLLFFVVTLKHSRFIYFLCLVVVVVVVDVDRSDRSFYDKNIQRSYSNYIHHIDKTMNDTGQLTMLVSAPCYESIFN